MAATTLQILQSELKRSYLVNRQSTNAQQTKDADNTATIQANAIWGAVGSAQTGYATQSWVTANFYPLTGNPSNFLTASAAAATYVPLTRTITINGTTQDLSANRTWTITNSTITLTGEASGSGTTSIAVTLSNAAVIGKLLTGYVSGAGTITASDSILTAIQKLNGNIASSYIPYTGATSNVDLGAYGLKTNYLTFNTLGHTTTPTQFLSVNSLNNVGYRTFAETLSDIGGVPTTRTLTINGTTYDLSANRSWTVGTGTVTSVGVSMPTAFTVSGSPITSSGTIAITGAGTTAQYIRGDGTLATFPTITSGTVTSVAMTVPTGLSISGSPITTSGTLALTLTSGYVIPTTTEETNWNTAYTNRITSLTTTGSSGAATLVSNTLNIPNYTIDGLLPSQASNSGKFLTTNGTSASWATVSASSLIFNGLIAATGTNTINNADYAQTWQWNTLSSNSGLSLTSTSTAAASNTQKLFNLSLSGANSNSTQTTYASYIANTHTGTSSTNVGGYFTASGGTNNYALLVDSGFVGIGKLSPTVPLDIAFTQNSSNLPQVIITNNGTGNSSCFMVNAGSTGNPNIAFGVSATAKGTLSWSVSGNALGIGNLVYSTNDFGLKLNSDGSLLFQDAATSTQAIKVTAAGRLAVGNVTANSFLQVGGSVAFNYVNKSANYTATVSDYAIECTTGTFTVTLPTSSGISGRIYIIKNTGTGIITIATTSSQTIDGASTKTLLTQYSCLGVMSNGSNWIVIQQI
jgi:hypothetical protein